MPASRSQDGSTACVIWRITDGRPGHDNQSLGLAAALAGRLDVVRHDLPAPGRYASVAGWLAGRFAPGDALPDPDLILGAGHACHLAMLAARRARGGRTVVLMSPSLPARWFDLCLIPEHDDPPRAGHVVATRGALNAQTPGGAHDPRRGLFLIGGPSAHFGWSDDDIAAQVAGIVAADPAVRWTLTTSRRTPASFPDALSRRRPASLEVVPCAATGPDWVARALSRSGQAWVSADSVSMIHEALTSGAATGILEAPAKRAGRVRRGLDALIDAGLVTPFSAWRDGAPLAPPAPPLDEAGRCADLIVDRFFR